jgi:hypothetical protein
MPEETVTETTDETQETQEVNEEKKVEDKPEPNDEVKKLRREAAGYRTERNTLKTENEALKAKVTELESGSEGVSARVTDLERENARLKVALDKGLPKELVPRLVGNNEEELATDADSLLALLGPERKGLNDGGVREQVNPPDLRTQIAEAEKGGNWVLARQLKSRLAHDLAQST